MGQDEEDVVHINDYRDIDPIVAGGSHRDLLSHECLGAKKGTRRLSLDIHRYQEGGHSVTNVHSHCEQGYFIISGQGEVTLGDRTHPITNGSYVYIPRNQPHSIKNTGEGELILVFMSVNLDQE